MPSLKQVGDLYTVHHHNMVKYLNHKQRLTEAEAEDIAQEVFLRLLRYPTDELITNPVKYLYTIAINVTNEWRERSRQSMQHTEEEAIEEFIDPFPTAEELLTQESEALMAQQLLEGLTLNQQAALLDHAEGLNYFQIAAKQKRTYRMVTRDIAKGLATLRKVLGLPAKHKREMRK